MSPQSGDRAAGPTLPDADDLLQALTANAAVALIALDLDGVVRRAGGEGLAFPAQELIGQSLTDLAQSDAQRQQVLRALTGEPSTALHTWGHRQWQAHYRPLHGPDGGLTGVAVTAVDITAQLEAEAAARAAEARLQAVLDAVPVATFMVGADGRLSWSNDSCEQLLGKPLPVGSRLADAVAPDIAAEVEDLVLRGGSPRDLALTDADGRTLWVTVSGRAVRDAAGHLLGSVGVLSDITAKKQSERRLQAAALVDAMTGVGNRVLMNDRLDHALQRRSGGLVAAMFCDVDGLKGVNDRLGHDAGDALLRHVADAAASAVRPADTVCRYGGDEFVVVCEDLHSPAEAVALAERVRDAVALPFPFADEELRPSVSIGVAVAPPCPDAQTLLRAADGAAYVAKRAGRNGIAVAEQVST